MDQKTENQIELKDRLIKAYRNNKIKIYILIAGLTIAIISLSFYKIQSERENNLISEKFIKAGLYISTDKKEMAKEILDEIIQSKNEFYSILALNKVLEKNLITDKNKIIKYFDLIEKNNSNKDQRDLLILKKSLYLIKMSEPDEGNKLLQSLIESNSKFKLLAEEIKTK
jgi:hypothetical protein